MELPKRKHPRLKEYDYSRSGFYYVTIHVAQENIRLSSVGRGLAPAETRVILTQAGRIAQEQLLALERRYPYVRIDKYVIMPTHIHAIIQFLEDAQRMDARPTLMDVIGVYKSLTTRCYNQLYHTPGTKLFQTSFYETVLRNERAYQECWRYIEENPMKWRLTPAER